MDRSPTDEEGPANDGWLIWAWLGPGSVTGLVAAVLVGAYVLTPGVPDCALYTRAGVTVCPWYRQYVRSVALLAVALLAGAVLVGLVAEGVRDALRRRG